MKTILIILQAIDTIDTTSNSHGSLWRKVFTTDYMGLIIGVLGLAFAIWQWLDSRKKQELYDRVFQLAKANLETEKTEEVLVNKKSELEKISDQLEKIKDEIPKEAKRTILKDKLENAKNSLYTTHKEIKRIKRDLLQIGESSLPDEVLDEVEDEIEPRFQLRERSNMARNILTLVSLSASIWFFLPYPFNRILPGVCYLLAAIIAIYLVHLNLKEQNYNSTKLFAKFFFYVICVLTFVGIIFSLFLIFLAFANRNTLYPDDFKVPLIMGCLLLIFCLVMGIAIYRIYVRKRKYLRE